MKAKVLKEHISIYPNPILFDVGEKVDLGELDSENPHWIKVRTEDGNEGWAPISSLNMVAGQKHAFTIESYTATELNVFMGEWLEMIKESNGWAWCQNETKEFGWVPIECIEITR